MIPESDYTSVRFTHAITFRGLTVDSLQNDERFILSHAPGAMLVFLLPAGPGISMQVRMVPWTNVACAEPTDEQLERLRGAPKAARK